MATDTYRDALKQAKSDLAEQVETLGRAQDCAEKAEKAIVELRQTIAALQRLCGEPEFVEEDALGLTDAIRMAFKTQEAGMYGLMSTAMSAQDVRDKMERMGYGGRWGNLLASIHTVIKRLHEKGELQAAGNLNGKETYTWIRRKTIGQMIAEGGDKPVSNPSHPIHNPEPIVRVQKLGHHKLANQIRDGKK